MSISQITSTSSGSAIADLRPFVKTTSTSPSSQDAGLSENSSVTPAGRQPEPEVSAKDLKSSVEQINRAIGLNNSVNLNLDDESGKVVVQIVDNKTKTVLRQIPSEEVLAIARDLDGKKGVLLNVHA